MLPSKVWYMMSGADALFALLAANAGSLLCVLFAVLAGYAYFLGEARKAEGK